MKEMFESKYRYVKLFSWSILNFISISVKMCYGRIFNMIEMEIFYLKRVKFKVNRLKHRTPSKTQFPLGPWNGLEIKGFLTFCLSEIDLKELSVQKKCWVLNKTSGFDVKDVQSTYRHIYMVKFTRQKWKKVFESHA